MLYLETDSIYLIFTTCNDPKFVNQSFELCLFVEIKLSKVATFIKRNILCLLSETNVSDKRFVNFMVNVFIECVVYSVDLLS